MSSKPLGCSSQLSLFGAVSVCRSVSITNVCMHEESAWCLICVYRRQGEEGEVSLEGM